MSERKDSPPEDDATRPDEDRAAILARRASFVAAALAGLAGTALVAGCSTDSPTPDASVTPDSATDGATPQPCLKISPDAATADTGPGDAQPQPCLSIAADAAPDAREAGPQPCLAPPLDSGR